jgi:hypothetical protein
MDWILVIGWMIAATVLYTILCKTFSITHFGCSAMFSFWFGCMLVVGVIFAFVGSLIMSIFSVIVGFITAHYRWIIGAVVLLIILGVLGCKSSTDGKINAIVDKKE